jgi:hypothetical protein
MDETVAGDVLLLLDVVHKLALALDAIVRDTVAVVLEDQVEEVTQHLALVELLRLGDALDDENPPPPRHGEGDKGMMP